MNWANESSVWGGQRERGMEKREEQQCKYSRRQRLKQSANQNRRRERDYADSRGGCADRTGNGLAAAAPLA